MDPTRWNRVRDIFLDLFEHPLEERAAMLNRRCGDDASLRNEVESLLAHDAAAGERLRAPSSFDAASLLGKSAPPLIGRRIGGYTLLRVLGRGGSGVVYEAEQSSPRRCVALKLLRMMPFSDDLAPRLIAREGQALARLNHAGIATIYEAGSTEDGWSYFAMERVEGAALTRFAGERRLSLRERLLLFQRVCDAVHYAHQRGVIHRDLKPSNILVTDSGQPKVLDFGLARLIDPDAEQTMQATEVGTVMGTLAYMSPEQARGLNDQIDTRSDVYSLGVVLYELLTGRLPYELLGRALPEAARIICEETPRPPCRIERAVRGDLETIVLKALEKEPERRYASAAALTDDIERVLTKQPIQARPASAGYHLRKLIARHKLPFGLAAGFLLAATSFAIIATAQAIRIGAERDKAVAAQQREAEARGQAEKVSDFFLMDLFEVTDPQKARVERLTAREVLDKGAQRIQERFQGQAETQATLMLSMGRVYESLGLVSNARELFESSRELREGLFGLEHPDVATAKFHLACVLGSEELQREVLQSRRQLLGDDHPDVAASRLSLAAMLRGRDEYDEAEQHAQQALTVYRARLGARSTEVASCLMTLGGVRNARGRYGEAEPLFREALEINQELFGASHAAVAVSLSGLGYSLHNNAQFARALPLLERAVVIGREVHGDESPQVARYVFELGRNLAHMGRMEEAEQAYREALAIHRKLYGDDAGVGVMENLAECLAARFDYDGAAALYEQAWQIRRRGRDTPPAGYEACGRCMSSLFHLEKPDFEAADRISSEGYAAICETDDEEGQFRVIAQHHRGLVLARLGRYDEAEELLQRSLELLRRLFADDHLYVGQMRAGLGSLLTERGNYDAAEPVLCEALRVFESLGEAQDGFRAGVLDDLATTLCGKEDYLSAEAVYMQALEIRKRVKAAEHPEVAATLLHLAELYHAKRDFDGALQLYEDALGMIEKFLRPIHPNALMARVGRGKAWMDVGNLIDAESELRDALLHQSQVLGQNHPHTARTEFLLGACLALQGETAEPNVLLGPALQRLTTAYPPQHKYVREAKDLQVMMDCLTPCPRSLSDSSP